MLDKVILSVMGPHAGESEDFIFNRKVEEIKREGYTFWVHHSVSADPITVRSFIWGCNNPIILFLAPSAKGGAKDTKSLNYATKYSLDKINWLEVPKDIKASGVNKGAYAFVIKNIELNPLIKEVDLSKYTVSDWNEEPRFMQGRGSLCCKINNFPRVKTRIRKVVASAVLCNPYSVYLK